MAARSEYHQESHGLTGGPRAAPLLAGLTALDLTGREGGLAARLLGELGMRVLRVERPPEPAGTAATAARAAELSYAFRSHGTELLDVYDDSEWLARLPEVDLLLHSRLPEDLPSAIAERSPALVVVGVTPYGATGPRRNSPATDATIFASSGLMALAGHPDEPPVCAPGDQTYGYASLVAVFAGLAALYGGGPEAVDVSMQECLASQEQMIREALTDGELVVRAGSQHKHVSPGRVYACSDGHVYLFVGGAHWTAFLDAWPNCPAELRSPEWQVASFRRANAPRLDALVGTWTGRRPKLALAEEMQAAGIPCLPVNTVGEFLDDPHTAARGLVLDAHSDHLGSYRTVAGPILVDGRRPLADEQSGGERSTTGKPPPPARPTVGPLLDGVRIVSLTTGIAGPGAATLLGRLGADVLKLESRNGGLDSFRFFGPDVDRSSRFVEANLGARSVTLDLKQARGRELARELVARADVLVENFRPDVLPRLGLDPAELRRDNPGLVVARLPGLGLEGPRATYGTWGPTIAAFAGLTWLWNHPDASEPVGSQTVYPDYVGSVVAALSVIAALLRRRATGDGALLEIPQAEAVGFLLGPQALERLVDGVEPAAVGNTRSGAALHDCFRCAGDDRWCLVACRSDAEWEAVCRVAGLDGGAADRRGAVAAWMETHDAEQVATALSDAGVPASPIWTARDLGVDAHLRERRFPERRRHPLLGEVTVARLPFLLASGRVAKKRPESLLGDDTAEILAELGASEEAGGPVAR